MQRNLYSFLIATSSLTFLFQVGCGPTSPDCSFSNCSSGCCDELGTCRLGVENAACGSSGRTCVACGSQSCLQGFCSGGGGGGGGGGNGGDGGTPDAGMTDGGPADGGTCADPLVACGGACVDTRTDSKHCGNCTTACPPGASCSAGGCVNLPADCTQAPCPAQGYYCDLSSKQCKSGCVLDTQCAAPLSKCDSASRACVCQPGSCGATSYCTAQGTCAAGCEQNSQCAGQTSVCNLSSHLCVCGASTCAPGSYCAPDGTCKTGCGLNSQCTASNENTCNQSTHACECNPGFHKCSGQCVSSSAITSCGSSCTPCAAPPAHATAACLANACDFTCDPYFFRVGSACYPMQTVARTENSGNEIQCRVNVQQNTTSCNTYIGSGKTDLVYLVADYNAVCGLSKNSEVYCAGRTNYAGDLGVGNTPSSSTTFLLLPNLPTTGLVKLTKADGRGFALTSSGAIWRWGDGWQIKDGNQPDPWAVTPAYTPVAFGSNAKDIAAGQSHLCVLPLAGTSITCTGGYSGSNGNYSSSTVNAPTGVVLDKISYASDHGCAIDTLGKVYCWGNGSGGRLGYSATGVKPLTVVPNFPPAGTKAVSVAVTSFYNSCAVLDNGHLYCWGQMGGSNTVTPTPTKMSTPYAYGVGSNRTRICVTDEANCFDP